MKMNMFDWRKSIIERKDRVAIPIMTHPGIEMCVYTVLQAVKDGEVHAKAIKALNDAYPVTAATTVIMDLTVEAEAFGAEIVFEENSIPTVTGRLVSDYDSVAALKVPDLTVGRVPEYIKANHLAAQYIKDVPVFGGCIGPFSLAGRLFDMSEMMMAIYIDEDTVKLLLEKCTEFILKYVKAIKEAGANGIVMAEPAAGLISNDDNLKFCTPYVKKIIDEVQDENFMIILHNCGNTGHCTDSMVASGAHGFHFGNQADMVEALENCPSDTLVMGNLDPVRVFKMMDAEVVKSTTAELLEKTAKYPNFVLSTGCDVPPQVPEENIKAFYEALKEFNEE